MTDYPSIFEPLTVKRMIIKNRVIMPPMGTNLAGLNGEFLEEHMNYYEQRAKGGTGLITIENACVDFPYGTNGTTQLRIDNDQYIPGFYKLTERLHKHGTCVSIQINHAGASAYPARLNGLQPVSASDIPSKKGGTVPRPLTIEEIYEIVNKYGDAARRAQQAGFDAVEIHGGHSYLLCQFLSPLYNKRTDEFGGTPENRARIVKLILEKVRAEVGPFFPIVLRFSADEFTEGGNHLEDILELLDYCQEEADILNVSAAINDNLYLQIDQMNLEDGWRSYLAKAVKDKFNKPTITSGNIRSPKAAEKILSEGYADLLAMGRGLIAEPNWVNKVATGQEDMLRKCISCNIGCADHRISKSKPIRCTVNPDIIHEDKYKETKVTRPTNVVVIGGGTAGLEAACTAAEVGCNTTLIEANEQTGGLARAIANLPDKSRIADFPNYLANRAEKLPNLKVITGTKADTALIDTFNPDVVVNATGSKPLLPPIKGLHDVIDKEGSKVHSIFGLISNIDDFTEFSNKKVAVIGGGAVGLDVVEYFSERGSDVTIVEMMPILGKDLDMITRLSMMDIIDKNHVDVQTETALTEVAADHFKVKHDGVDAEIPFDYGFVCLGMRPERPLMEELAAYGKEKHIEIVNIGDSAATRKILEGVREGRNILTTLEKIGSL
ncbi:FAD-dependent oxidoreductase [Listeria monocytogenes]|uniref:NAD(P)/FAD-dependent oxidoreductase n=1 Tax=Listeria monocytogenes TaxID=1639 RepID=UPI0015E6E4B0|nr:NAD(P)/FAD-dependent oxidoreductase [Listeria monocytogenes]EAO7445059.1 FAD-dependent oxidoreductase [Listeria monocytogenes]